MFYKDRVIGKNNKAVSLLYFHYGIIVSLRRVKHKKFIASQKLERGKFGHKRKNCL